MKLWITTFEAINPQNNELCTFIGDIVAAESWEDAQNWCYQYKGHLRVIGEMVQVINHRPITVDYKLINYN